MNEADIKVNDVFLARFGSSYTLLTIKNIAGQLLLHNYGWETIVEFNGRQPQFYGRRKRFLKIFPYIDREKNV